MIGALSFAALGLAGCEAILGIEDPSLIQEVVDSGIGDAGQDGTDASAEHTADASVAREPDASGQAVLAIEPSSHDHGSVVMGTVGNAVEFEVANVGDATGGSILAAIFGDEADDFVVSEDFCAGLELAPAETCSVIIQFSPQGGPAGERTGTLEVSADPGGIVTASLSGTAVAPLQVSPSSTDFGTVAVGQSANAVLTVDNTGTETTGEPAAFLSGDADFAITANNCTTPFAAGSSCSVTIEFAPQDPGVKSATFEISASPGGSASASLTGEGAEPPPSARTP